MKDVGIVGLPQSGKTTLFNALTRAGVPAGGAAGKASVAAVPVPDPRVDVLSELERSRKKVFVQARFVDVAWGRCARPTPWPWSWPPGTGAVPTRWRRRPS